MTRRSVYMDNHATTPVDPRVLEAMLPFFTEHFGNAASVQHRFGWIAKEAVEIARKHVAGLLKAQTKEIVFTSSATESNNLAIKGAAEVYRSKGDHIITAATEHQCVLGSCRMLEQQGFRITVLPVDAFGRVSVEEIRNAMTDRTFLVSVMTANNEIGTIQPAAEIGALCKERGILFHTDATQSAGKLPIDVDAMGIDLLSFTSHKMYGPKGAAALYIRSRNPRVTVAVQMHGAGHEHGLRSGTLNVPAIVGFGKAVQIAMEQMEEENGELFRRRNRLQEQLLRIPGSTVNGHPTERLPNNLSISFRGVRGDQVMTAMSDVAVSAGSACLSEEIGDSDYSHVLQAIGLNGEAARSTLRFGVGRFTTDEDIAYTAARVAETVSQLRERSMIGTV
jgi:cysteine desulfurase